MIHADDFSPGGFDIWPARFLLYLRDVFDKFQMNFFKNSEMVRCPVAMLGIAIIFCVLSSLPGLTTTPKLWIDEGISIEIARNFSSDRVLDVKISPNEYSEIPYLLQATGYTVTIPLSFAFSLFGHSPEVARGYMLSWLVVALIAIFLFVKKYFSETEAGFAVFLVATFASFYGTGRSVMGEIPGLVFLLLGLYSWLSSKYRTSGFFVLLCIISKPSIYLLVLPAFLLAFIYSRGNWRQVLYAIQGGVFPVIAWFFFSVSEPFNPVVWHNLINFYRNPFFGQSMSQNILTNLSGLLSSTTILYFLILGSVVFLSWRFGRAMFKREIAFIYLFVATYSIFAFFYYLRSPGYLRYILAAEIFILLLMPFAARIVFEKFSTKLHLASSFLSFALVLLTILQSLQMFYFSNIYPADGPLLASAYINDIYTERSVGSLNAIEVASFFKTDKRFNVIEDIGTSLFGSLSMFDKKERPEVLLVNTRRSRFYESHKDQIQSLYDFDKKVGGYDIYTLRTHD